MNHLTLLTTLDALGKSGISQYEISKLKILSKLNFYKMEGDNLIHKYSKLCDHYKN